MLYLNKSLKASQTEQFKQVFIEEIMSLNLDQLPLQKALRMGSFAINDNLQIMINRISEQNNNLIINTSIFFSSIIAGCNCADDPSPIELNTEYCEMQFSINKSNAQTEIDILS